MEALRRADKRARHGILANPDATERSPPTSNSSKAKRLKNQPGAADEPGAIVGDDPSAANVARWPIHVMNSKGVKVLETHAKPTATVGDLKKRIEAKVEIPAGAVLRLRRNGMAGRRLRKNNRSIARAGLTHGSAVLAAWRSAVNNAGNNADESEVRGWQRRSRSSCVMGDGWQTVPLLPTGAAPRDSAAPAAPASPPSPVVGRKLWVQHLGDTTWTEIIARPSLTIENLLVDALRKLPSLANIDASEFCVHRRRGELMDMEPLAVKHTIAEALPSADDDQLVVIHHPPRVRPAMTVEGDSWFSLTKLPLVGTENPISRVVNDIRAGLVEEMPGGHLRLPAGTNWPVATNNLLFVRKCYKPLFETVLNQCLPVESGDDRRQRQIVRGQPGIGKSVWAWYVIYRILTDPMRRRTVVYARYDDDCAYVIPPAGPVRLLILAKEAFAPLSMMRGITANDTVVIADSRLPSGLLFPTLVVSSPGYLASRDCKRTLKEYFIPRYMPIPTVEEVMELRALAFPMLPVKDVERRIDLWGPIPQHVLVGVTPEEQWITWESVKAVSIDKIMRVAREELTPEDNGSAGGDEKDVSHRIVHKHAMGETQGSGLESWMPAYYLRGSVTLASPAMLQHVIERVISESHWKATVLIDASVGIGKLGALRGLKFEERMLSLCETGCRLKCRDLQAPFAKNTMQVIPAAARIAWSTVHDLPSLAGTPSMLVPVSGNNAGFDALIWDGEAKRHWPADFTVAETHEINAVGLLHAVEKLGWTCEHGWSKPGQAGPPDMTIKYFWIIPADRFDPGWTRVQPLKATSSKPSVSRRVDVLREHVKQFALRVPPALDLLHLKSALEAGAAPLARDLVRAPGVPVAGAAGALAAAPSAQRSSSSASRSATRRAE